MSVGFCLALGKNLAFLYVEQSPNLLERDEVLPAEIQQFSLNFCIFLRSSQLDLPDISCVSQMLGGPSLRLGIPLERLSILPGTGRGGNDTGRLVTWDCPLRTDSAS